MYFGLETIQEYSCGADGTAANLPNEWPCSTSMPLVREFVWGGEGDQGGSLNGHLSFASAAVAATIHGTHAQERFPEVVAMIRHNPDTQDEFPYHYLHDVLGSAIGLVGYDGKLVERYTYDPYGRTFAERRAGGPGAAQGEARGAGAPQNLKR